MRIARLLLLMFLFVPVLFTGCEVVPFIGPAVNVFITWQDGQANAYFATDATTAYNAVKRTLKEMDLPITSDEASSATKYNLVADANDRFKITVEQIEAYTTRVSIRVNIFGDKEYAEMIYSKLRRQIDIIDYQRVERLRLKPKRLKSL